MRKTLIIMLLLFLATSTTCFGKEPADARVALAQMGFHYNETTFLRVIEKKDNIAVSLFLDAGVDPNYVSVYNNTPLTTAALYNNLDAVKLLIAQHNINMQWKDNMGRTAADIAYLFDNQEIVDLFKINGVDVTITKKPSVSNQQIQQALEVGKALRKNIAFVDKIHSSANRALFSKVEAEGRGYWLTPFCEIATEQMEIAKKQEEIKPEVINRLANSYQAKLVLLVSNDNFSNLAGLKIIALQDERIIHPYAITWGSPKVSYLLRGACDFGITATFNGYDIDPQKPIELKVIIKGIKDLVFKFEQSNGNNAIFYKEGNDDYKW